MERGEQSIEVPIFELPLAALPGERVPLHIFEPRYRMMIAHCLEEDEELGILLRTDSGAREIGCAARITEVLERFDDGRLNVLATGSWRFRLQRRYDGDHFPMASVSALEEPAGSGANPEAAIAAFRQLLEAVGSQAEPGEELRTAYAIAGRVEIPVERKQQLLESDSETERLELLCAALEELIKEVEASKRVAQRAQTNGHAPIEGLRPPETGG